MLLSTPRPAASATLCHVELLSAFGAVHAVFLNGVNTAWDEYVSSEGKRGFELLLTNGGRNLHLRDRGIDDAQFGLLVEDLATSGVETLDLQRNSLTDESALALAAVLAQSKLRWISLNSNRITGGRGAVRVASLGGRG